MGDSLPGDPLRSGASPGRRAIHRPERITATITAEGSLFSAPTAPHIPRKPLLLQFPQFAPAGVLGGLGWIGVFFALKPEAEPIDVALRRG